MTITISSIHVSDVHHKYILYSTYISNTCKYANTQSLFSVPYKSVTVFILYTVFHSFVQELFVAHKKNTQLARNNIC